VAAVVRSSQGDLADIYHLGQENPFQLSLRGEVIYQTLTWQELRPEWSDGVRPEPPVQWRSPEGAFYWIRKGQEPTTGFQIVFAQNVTETIAYLRNLAYVFIAGLPVALILSILGGYFLAGRALSPFEDITNKAAGISAENLTERLPVHNPNDEIGRLTAVFNDTLARLDSSFQRLRRFTADASHELRNPLTSIRSVGEVALQGPSDRKAYEEAIGSMLEETERLTHLVDNLLTLARSDAGEMNQVPCPLNVSNLVREVVEELSILAEEKGQTVVSKLPPEIRAAADEAGLRRAVANVLHNAIRYCSNGGRIEVRVRADAVGAAIDILDDGPGIPPAERTKVFDRFYQIPGNSTRSGGGAGLGLSIARSAVEASGGTIAFLDKTGAGTHCRITLPAVGA